MDNVTVACVQPRLSILATHDDFEAYARRFLRQTKSAQLVIFPELTGLMLAPPLISGLKLGMIKRADQGRHPTAGFVSRGVGQVADATASALGGGLYGSLSRLLSKKADLLYDAYVEVFGGLAREYGRAIVAGSLYISDDESGTVRHRAYLFESDGEVIGFQDKLNLGPGERRLASPGSDLKVFDTRLGRLGLLIGHDILYPELARLLAVQGADLLVGIAACPGAGLANVVRSALALRVEENQLFSASSFMLGPNYLDPDSREDFYGRSSVLTPIRLSEKGDGVLVQTGTDRTEGVVSAVLEGEALEELRRTSRFRPRQEMNLGGLGPVLAKMYGEGQSIEEALSLRATPPEGPELPAEPFIPVDEAGEESDDLDLEAGGLVQSVPEALSLTGQVEANEE
jgi:predicted amidohydrolase